MTTHYQISDATNGLDIGSTNRFATKAEAIECAKALDALDEGWDCEVQAVDSVTGVVTGCVWGAETWGAWDEQPETWTAAQCWPDFAGAMQSLGVTSETTDEQTESIAAREAPKAAVALGCVTDVDEFAAAMRAYRDEL